MKHPSDMARPRFELKSLRYVANYATQLDDDADPFRKVLDKLIATQDNVQSSSTNGLYAEGHKPSVACVSYCEEENKTQNTNYKSVVLWVRGILNHVLNSNGNCDPDKLMELLLRYWLLHQW